METCLIGTGFYADAATISEKRTEWFAHWLPNTRRQCSNVVVVDNSSAPGLFQYDYSYRIVRVRGNLGHMSAPARHATRYTGWSLSWMIPALMAYSEGLDFCYKEQDCYASGPWLEAIQCGDFTVGRNSMMPCEQSLFFIRNHAILDVLARYQAIRQSDCQVSTEEKFTMCGATFHEVGPGRDRPLNMSAPLWSAQKLTKEEIYASNPRLV
jgi:hypothetical protein